MEQLPYRGKIKDRINYRFHPGNQQEMKDMVCASLAACSLIEDEGIRFAMEQYLHQVGILISKGEYEAALKLKTPEWLNRVDAIVREISEIHRKYEDGEWHAIFAINGLDIQGTIGDDSSQGLKPIDRSFDDQASLEALQAERERILSFGAYFRGKVDSMLMFAIDPDSYELQIGGYKKQNGVVNYEMNAPTADEELALLKPLQEKGIVSIYPYQKLHPER